MEKLPTITPNRFVLSPANSHPEQIGHYVPARTRDAKEARRRRQNPTGTLILEQQARGFEIIKKGLLAADNFSQLVEWSSIAVPAAIGASQYHLNGAVMHRYIPLPQLAHHEPKLRPNADAMREQALDRFDAALTYADILLSAHRFASRRKYNGLALRAGRAMTNAALTLHMIPLSETTADPASELSNKAVQELVRDRSLEVVRRTSDIALEIGAMPSAAQLADRLSPLSVELQRTASDAVDRIYNKAAA